MTATARIERRELAHRTSDGIDVTLYWSKSTNEITLEVVDSRSGERLEFGVDGHAALDAFEHPYAYAADRGSAARGSHVPVEHTTTEPS